jgi:hypothetical protein
MTNIRSLIADIYFGKITRREGETDEEWEARLEQHKKYVIPLKGDWAIPTADPGEDISTWIGYQISEIEPVASAILKGKIMSIECKVKLRLWAMGKQAEEFITDCLFWDYRADVRGIFEKYMAKLNLSPRRIFSQLYSQEGFNSELCWLTDLSIMSYYRIDMELNKLCKVTFTGDYPIHGDVDLGKQHTKWKDGLEILIEEAGNE